MRLYQRKKTFWEYIQQCHIDGGCGIVGEQPAIHGCQME